MGSARASAGSSSRSAAPSWLAMSDESRLRAACRSARRVAVVVVALAAAAAGSVSADEPEMAKSDEPEQSERRGERAPQQHGGAC